ncbi:MAG: DegT/DnrJ/EryC1/StrS family aminotransferase [Planctomycetota bacterium]
MSAPGPVPLMDPQRTYGAWGPDAERDVLAVLRSNTFVRGPRVAELERRMALRLATARAVAVGSGTQALSLVLGAWLRDRAPDAREVVVPAFSFIATAGAVLEAGGTPVFADVDAESFLLDPASVAEVASARTAAVVPVHLFGAPVDLAPLRAALDAAGASDALVLEDAAQAIDATWQGAPVGSLGDAAAFSFYPSKNLAAAGDAGLVSTPDVALADRVARLREHGAGAVAYEHLEPGTNARMDEMQAAVLLARLAHLSSWTADRRLQAQRYIEALAGSAATPQRVDPRAESAWHLFVVRVAARDAVRARLAEAGVSSGVYYPLPLHRQPALGPWNRRALPVAERLAGEVLALPCFPGLTDGEQQRVLDALRRALDVA